MSIFKKQRVRCGESCVGCKNLDLNNDGSGFCTKDHEHVCFISQFIFKEPKKENPKESN